MPLVLSPATTFLDREERVYGQMAAKVIVDNTNLSGVLGHR
jgi:hypothetical protein